MRRSTREGLILAAACLLAGAKAWGQQIRNNSHVSTDMAITYAAERAQSVPGDCCFWMQGGAADGAVTFWKGLGIGASLSGEHYSNYLPGIDVNKISYLAGPRYTYTVKASNLDAKSKPRFIQIFGQGLFGGVHGFDGVYPINSGNTSSASSFALQVGGGLNLFLARNFGMRLLEVDYVRTALPNSAANAQDDLSLAFGVAYHLDSVSIHHR